MPVTATQLTCASGTSSASRPTPLRARITRPLERVPSGKTPTQEPSRSAATALASACASPAPRTIGIWPMPSRTGARPLTSQSVDLASARIIRRLRAENPIITGSQWLSWLPTRSSGPLAGSVSTPLDLEPPPGGDRKVYGHRDAVGAGGLAHRAAQA